MENVKLENQKTYRNPILQYSEIDNELNSWIDRFEKLGAIINDKLVGEKALKIAKELGFQSFKASHGWLIKFKSRHLLKLRRLHGESYSSTPIPYDEFLKILSLKIDEHGFENISNADERWLFYKIIPSKSICNKVRTDYKLLKDRISVLICVNITGTVKRKPLVIGKFAKPRCFKNFSYNSFDNYTNSIKAWMTADIFNK